MDGGGKLGGCAVLVCRVPNNRGRYVGVSKMSLDEKRKQALAYLGTKYVLHPQYNGKHAYTDPAHVRLTIKREQRRLAEVKAQGLVVQFSTYQGRKL